MGAKPRTAPRKPGALYFTTVAAFPNGAAVVGGHLVSQGSDPTGTRLMSITRDGWRHIGDVMEVVYAIALVRPPGDTARLSVLGRDGLYREYIAGSRDLPVPVREVGYLESVCPIGGDVWVCGAQGQVYRLSAGRWHAAHRGLFRKFDGEVERMMLSIAGQAPDDLIACGCDGDVWRFDGKKWRALSCPATLPLNAALAAPDGSYFVCGEGGTLLRLTNDDRFTVLASGSERAFTDLSLFRGELHIAAGDALLRWTGDKLQPLAPQDGTVSVSAISAADDLLWCVGGEEPLDFDGHIWRRHPCPENR